MLPRGQIFYDATCGLCNETYRRFGEITKRRGFRWIPVQNEQARELLGLEEGQVPDELKLLTTKGRMLGGVDAALHIARSIWWAWPAWLLSHIPGVPYILHRIYRRIAANRHHISQTCGFDPSTPPVEKAA